MNELRVALIHATPVAVAPVADAFERLWPQARLMNLLDDSLAPDLAERGGLDDALVRRFVALARHAHSSGARGILFTCSAFGAAIDAAAAAVPIPTYKPNQAMFGEALAARPRGAVLRIGLLSTFEPSVQPMAREFAEMAARRGVAATLQTACAAGALQALGSGDAAAHDRLVLQASAALADCDAVMLGQFSMARARQAVARQLGRPVLASPDSAVALLKQVLHPARSAAPVSHPHPY